MVVFWHEKVREPSAKPLLGKPEHLAGQMFEPRVF